MQQKQQTIQQNKIIKKKYTVKRDHVRVSQNTVKKLINLFNNQKLQTNSQISLRTNLSASRIFLLRSEYFETGTIRVTTKNRKSKKIEQKNKSLAEIVTNMYKNNPCLTLEHVRKQLQIQGIYICKRKIGQLLKKERFSYKKLSYIPFSRNDSHVLQLRYDYCRELIGINDSNLYFTDQTSFNLKTAPLYGWAKIGKQATIRIADSSGETVSVIAIVSVNGLVGFTIIKGTAKTQNIQNNMKMNALPNITFKDILIMDNARSHHAQEIMVLIKETGLQVKYLPPYSPQLNPIQNLFGTVKARFRRLRAQRDIKTTNQLISLVRQVFEEQYGVDLSKYYKKMREYINIGIQNLPFDNNI